MCYYISKVYQFEIIRMKAEFAKDENNSIWFQYASEIYVRKNYNAQKEQDEKMRTIKKMNELNKQKLQKELSNVHNYDKDQVN